MPVLIGYDSRVKLLFVLFKLWNCQRQIHNLISGALNTKDHVSPLTTKIVVIKSNAKHNSIISESFKMNAIPTMHM